MFENYSFFYTVLIIIVGYIIIYSIVYTFFLRRVNSQAHSLLLLFLRKISKVPALIEVMRPYVVKEEAFDALIRVHMESMVESSNSLYDILENNARVQNEFLFLMQLSVHAKGLQKDEYFIYIRDFILSYEHEMKSRFSEMNRTIRRWNSFIRVKNATGIGLFLPGKILPEII